MVSPPALTTRKSTQSGRVPNEPQALAECSSTGTAILSRYRLENVKLIPFRFQPHDWYEDEKKGVAPVEKGKRKVAEHFFLEKIYR
jgi:hypothetical protein